MQSHTESKEACKLLPRNWLCRENRSQLRGPEARVCAGAVHWARGTTLAGAAFEPWLYKALETAQRFLSPAALAAPGFLLHCRARSPRARVPPTRPHLDIGLAVGDEPRGPEEARGLCLREVWIGMLGAACLVRIC